MLYFPRSGNQSIEGGEAPTTSNDLLWEFLLLILAPLGFGRIGVPGLQKGHILAKGHSMSAIELKVVAAVVEFLTMVKKKSHHIGNWS